MVLADKAEDAFRWSIIMAGGKLSIFWAYGLVGLMMPVALLLLSVAPVSILLRAIGGPLHD